MNFDYSVLVQARHQLVINLRCVLDVKPVPKKITESRLQQINHLIYCQILVYQSYLLFLLTFMHVNYPFKLTHFNSIELHNYILFFIQSLEHFRFSAFRFSILENDLQSLHRPIIHLKDFASHSEAFINVSFDETGDSFPLMRKRR